MHILPDTRPYPTDPVKNELLMYAGQIIRPTSGAQRKLAQEHLHAQLHTMLSQHNTLSLSVAMTMAPDADTYTALIDALNDALNAVADTEEVQWFALPVVLVCGTKQTAQLKTETPVSELAMLFAEYAALRPFVETVWLPHLMNAADFATIKAEQWFDAKQNLAAAEHFAAQWQPQPITIPKDQSVHVVYAVGYGKPTTRLSLGQALRDAALPLMQLWQQHFAQKEITLFANPLSPSAPLAALTEGSRMRLQMALDVFSANAIRAVRLQSPRIGVVMAAQEGGKLLFGFNASDSAFELETQIFSWPLSPRENIALVQQHFLNLMLDCQVEQVYLLHHPLPENMPLPSFAEAQKLSGNNPL